jgi:hypothetical protein
MHFVLDLLLFAVFGTLAIGLFQKPRETVMTSKQTSALTDRPGGYKGRCLKSRVGQNLRLFGLHLLNQEPDARLENETADSASVRGPKIADLLWELPRRAIPSHLRTVPSTST